MPSEQTHLRYYGSWETVVFSKQSSEIFQRKLEKLWRIKFLCRNPCDIVNSSREASLNAGTTNSWIMVCVVAKVCRSLVEINFTSVPRGIIVRHMSESPVLVVRNRCWNCVWVHLITRTTTVESFTRASPVSTTTSSPSNTPALDPSFWMVSEVAVFRNVSGLAANIACVRALFFGCGHVQAPWNDLLPLVQRVM